MLQSWYQVRSRHKATWHQGLFLSIKKHARTRQLRVLLDVTIHDFPCIDLSLDYQDVTRKLRISFVVWNTGWRGLKVSQLKINCFNLEIGWDCFAVWLRCINMGKDRVAISCVFLWQLHSCKIQWCCWKRSMNGLPHPKPKTDALPCNWRSCCQMTT